MFDILVLKYFLNGMWGGDLMKKLFIQAILKFMAGVLLTGILLFLPAGSFAYQNGWLLMALLFIPMFLARNHFNDKKSRIIEETIKQ